MRQLNLDVYEPGEQLATMSSDGVVTIHRVTAQGAVVPLNSKSVLVGPLTRDSPIEDLDPQLSVRSYNLLKREGVNTIGDMCTIYDTAGREGFLDFRNCGEKNADEIVGHIQRLRGEEAS